MCKGAKQVHRNDAKMTTQFGGIDFDDLTPEEKLAQSQEQTLDAQELALKFQRRVERLHSIAVLYHGLVSPKACSLWDEHLKLLNDIGAEHALVGTESKT